MLLRCGKYLGTIFLDTVSMVCKIHLKSNACCLGSTREKKP
uniref:Uncharacterized protein n=1 Tax=Arundo donax TaxID=35708 RepID=A0A0A9CQR3_ARUDO